MNPSIARSRNQPKNGPAFDWHVFLARTVPIAYLGCCIGLLVGLAVTPSGSDYFETFDKVAHGCLTCAYYPYHFSWFLRPLSLFADWKMAYLAWVVICFALLWVITKTLGGNPLIPLLAGTSVWNWWLGQVDIIPLTGILLAWVGTSRKRPLLVSLGFVLLSAKPQIGLLPILLFLWWNRANWKQLFVFPIIAAVLTFAIYGIDWPLRWLRETPAVHIPLPAAQYVHHPVFLLLLPGIYFMSTPLRKLQYLLVIVCIGIPYVGTYGYLAFLLFPVRWWEVAIGYLGPLGILAMNSPWGLSFVILQPLLILARLAYTEVTERRGESAGGSVRSQVPEAG
jgi:hypothetical protein